MQLTFYKHRKNFMAYSFNKMQINFYELTIVLHGQLRYEINDEPIVLNAKDALFLKPNSFRKRANATQPVDYVSIHFLTDESLDFPVKIPNAARSFVPALLMCADKLWEELLPDAKTATVGIVQSLLSYIQANLSQTGENPVIAAAKRYIHANLDKKITVKDVARHLHFSPSYCNAMFKRATGYPILTYFTQIRIEEAKTLLLSGEYSLQEIAETLGFDDYNYFSRIFKKHVGLPPGEYKKKFLI